MNGSDEIAKCDFFISYHHRDEAWAEWIAWQLEEFGYSVRSHAWDLAAGSFIGLEMQKAASMAECTIAVLSSNYLDSSITQAEWTAAFQQQRDGRQKVIPVRIQKRNLHCVLSSANHIDLVSGTANECRRRLFDGVGEVLQPAGTGLKQAGRSQAGTQEVIDRDLDRWRDKLAFLQEQLPKLRNMERNVFVAQSIESAENRICQLRVARDQIDSDGHGDRAVRPVFPLDPSDFSIPGPREQETPSDSSEYGDRFSLLKQETTIGRHPACDICVEVKSVSRFHAKITRRGDQYSVADTGSRNGTFLNNREIHRWEYLRSGDRIRLGKVEFEFRGQGTMWSLARVKRSRRYVSPAAKLEALKCINANLGHSLALDDILPRVLDSLFTIFPAADRGFVILKEPDGNIVPRWIKHRHRSGHTDTSGISVTVVRQVIESETPVLSDDAREDQRFDGDSVSGASMRSMICAPLRDGEGKVFGALQIDSTHSRGQFNQVDLDLLAGVATQAGIVINNVRMHQRELDRQQVRQDRQLANQVRQAFLPQGPPHASGYHVCNFYHSAPRVGGDYYDYIDLPDGRVAIVVADIVGHGIAAAMFMGKLSAETRNCLASEQDPVAAICRLNDRLGELHVDRFVTMLLLIIDPASSRIAVVNAGHPPPLLYSADNGSVQQPGAGTSTLPLAIAQDSKYGADQWETQGGDVIVMFTDGVTQAMNDQQEVFGLENLQNLVAQGGGAEAIKDRVATAVTSHVGEAPLLDDLCMVVIQRLAE